MVAKDGHIIFDDKFPLDAIGSPPVNFLVEVVRHAALLEEWDKELDADLQDPQDLEDKRILIALFSLMTLHHRASRKRKLNTDFHEFYTDLFIKRICGICVRFLFSVT
jgi:hypothetical protein